LQVGAFTQLQPPPRMAVVRAVRRAEWVGALVEGLRDALEPAASQIAQAMSRADLSGLGLPDDASGPGQMQQVMGPAAPLMLGIQVGQVLGTVGARAFGRYDVAVPTSDTTQMLFVMPSIQEFERDWSVPPTEFRTWVALHEVAHRFAFARPFAAA